MESRNRVIDVIEHRKPDRMPVYGWVRANLEPQITAAFGSVEAFEDHYAFDLAHLFGGPAPYDEAVLGELRAANGDEITPRMLLDVPLSDPEDGAAYAEIVEGIAHHKTARGRFVYVQTPGIFECLNGPFGIEAHLTYLALYPDDLHAVYARQSAWNRAFANHCIDLGVDMVHVSDDWGGQWGPLFSPRMWQRLIYPYHKVTCDAVRERGAYLSLHTDGNVMMLLDGIVKLGYQVLHPFQESAGMDVEVYRAKYAGDFVLMGGLDIQTTLGFGKLDRLTTEIRRLVETFRDGGLILCTSHYVQDHCTIEELTFAYDLVTELVREK
jgi:uroporphyrinogen decarboxylase